MILIAGAAFVYRSCPRRSRVPCGFVERWIRESPTISSARKFLIYYSSQFCSYNDCPYICINLSLNLGYEPGSIRIASGSGRATKKLQTTCHWQMKVRTSVHSEVGTGTFKSHCFPTRSFVGMKVPQCGYWSDCVQVLTRLSSFPGNYSNGLGLFSPHTNLRPHTTNPV